MLALEFAVTAYGNSRPAEAPATAARVRNREPSFSRPNAGPNEAGQPLVGKITTINKGSLELAKPDGTTVAVKTTDKTEYRRTAGARLQDFKVGDMVFVRERRTRITA